MEGLKLVIIIRLEHNTVKEQEQALQKPWSMDLRGTWSMKLRWI